MAYLDGELPADQASGALSHLGLCPECKALAAVFKGGPLTKTEAVSKLGADTGASRASCYRALDKTGRFAGHLRYENGKVIWH